MYSVEDLIFQDSGDINEEVIEYFVNSSLSNDYFLQQFKKPYPQPFCHKKYWECFAIILVKRGLPRIKDVICEILIWWQDTNWPGFSVVEKYLLEKRAEVLDNVKKSCMEAVKEKDPIWLKNLLTTFFSTAPFVEEVCEFLEDDSWKNFDQQYDVVNILSELK